MRSASGGGLCCVYNLTSILIPLTYHPLASFQNDLGWTLLRHTTSPALLTSPTPYQREFVCGACIGSAQVGASLVAPLGVIFKRSSLRSSRDMIIIPCHIYLYCLYSARYSRANTHDTPPYPSCLLPCIVEMHAYRDLRENLSCIRGA